MDDESLDEIKEEALYSVYFDRNEDYYFRCLEKVRRGCRKVRLECIYHKFF